MRTIEEVRELFVFEHLPPHLREVSSEFYELATHLFDVLPSSPERTITLRKLWEAKNYAVWLTAKTFKE